MAKFEPLQFGPENEGQQKLGLHSYLREDWSYMRWCSEISQNKAAALLRLTCGWQNSLSPILAVSQDRVLEAPRLGLQLSIPFANKTGNKQAEQVKVG